VFHLIDHLLPKPQNHTALESAALPIIRRSSLPLSPCRALLYAALLALVLSAAGCSGRKQTARNVPPAPSLPENPPAATPGTKKPSAAIHVDPHSPVLWTQVGYASWYGPNYHNKKAANGEIYNQNEMTAAHNTLPLNSIVRVVNLKSNQSTVVRITDRGPFVGDRIIDLSAAAAKAVNVYLPGTARVRLDVLQAPRPIETGGRWCVQIGAFDTESAAMHMKKKLLHRYPDAQLLQFKGPTGYWVRIRVAQEGAAFMVRLD
jgi:rare lipoprotein A